MSKGASWNHFWVLVGILIFLLLIVPRPQREVEDAAATLQEIMRTTTVSAWKSYYNDTTGRKLLLPLVLSGVSKEQGRDEINSLEEFVEIFHDHAGEQTHFFFASSEAGKQSAEIVRFATDSVYQCTVDGTFDPGDLQNVLQDVFYGEEMYVSLIDSVLLYPYEKHILGDTLHAPEIVIWSNERGIVAEMKLR